MPAKKSAKKSCKKGFARSRKSGRCHATRSAKCKSGKVRAWDEKTKSYKCRSSHRGKVFNGQRWVKRSGKAGKAFLALKQ